MRRQLIGLRADGLCPRWLALRWPVRPALMLAGVAVLDPAGAQAQDTEWNRYTLEGLAGAYVQASVGDRCASLDLSPTTIRADAELGLIEGDVEVLTEGAMLESPGLPELVIEVDCAEGENGVVAYAVALRMQQAVQMVRDPQITLAEAVTWYATGVGVATPATAAGAVGETLAAKIQEFATAFVAANAGDRDPG
jgi:hypothetical protein